MKQIILSLSAILFSACAHTVTLNPNINPNAFTGQKIPGSPGVVIPDELAGYVEHARPSSFVGSAHTYNFELGKALTSALIRSVEVAYQNVMLLKQNPTKGEFDKLIKFTLQNSNIDVHFQEGFFSSTGRANYSLSIAMEAYDGKTLALLRKTVVNGTGFSARSTDAFSADKKFAVAVESAIQKVSDDVANLLLSGFAESSKNYQSTTNERPALENKLELDENTRPPYFRAALPEAANYSDDQILESYRKKFPKLHNKSDDELIGLIEATYKKKTSK